VDGAEVAGGGGQVEEGAGLSLRLSRHIGHPRVCEGSGGVWEGSRSGGGGGVLAGIEREHACVVAYADVC
jgi:hypothetical protein